MRPVVLCFSGLDPSGGAGLQADIEAILATGSHASVACTAITVQDSQQVYGFTATPTDLLLQQAQAVLQDLPVKVIKSGMLGSISNIDQLQQILSENSLKFVLDPVLVANSGGSLIPHSDLPASIHKAIKQLLPYADVVTPNSYELKQLTNIEDLDEAAKQLCAWGAKAVYVKSAHQSNLKYVCNRLFENGELVYSHTLPRLNAEFHGSGCSLASAIASKLAQGFSLMDACQFAEVWLQTCLKNADAPHQTGQLIPNRLA